MHTARAHPDTWNSTLLQNPVTALWAQTGGSLPYGEAPWPNDFLQGCVVPALIRVSDEAKCFTGGIRWAKGLQKAEISVLEPVTESCNDVKILMMQILYFIRSASRINPLC